MVLANGSMDQLSNPQAAYTDPLFDYQRMRDPETYYVPHPHHVHATDEQEETKGHDH